MRPIAVLHRGRGDGHGQQQTEGVHGDVSLAAVDLLPAIEMAAPTVSAALTDWESNRSGGGQIGAATRHP